MIYVIVFPLFYYMIGHGIVYDFIFHITYLSQNLERVGGIEPPSKRWQRLVITVIRHPQMAIQKRLELSTSAVTGRCSNQLNYWTSCRVRRPTIYSYALFRIRSKCCWPNVVELTGVEPATSSVQGRRSPNWATAPRTSIYYIASVTGCQPGSDTICCKLSSP